MALEDEEQEELGSQFGEPIGTPHPSIFKGLGFNTQETPEGEVPELGAVEAVGSGVRREFAETGALLAHGITDDTGIRATAKARYGIEFPKDDRTPEEKESAFERGARDWAKSMAPDPKTTGSAYQTIQGLSEFATKMALGAPAGPVGSAMTTFGITQYQSYHDYKDQGVDDVTAKKLANLDAGVSSLFAISGGVGSFGIGAETGLARKLMQEAAAGVTANVGLGATNRYLDHDVLERAGYHDLAEQQKVWDGQQILMDMAMGLIPVGFEAARHAKEMYDNSGMVRDAVSVANQANGISRLAPGVAVDNKSAEFHEIALQTATAQHLAGESIDPARGPLPQSATFASRSVKQPDIAVVRAFAQHLTEAGFTEELGGLDADTKNLVEKISGKLPEVQKEPAANDLDRAVVGEPEAPEFEKPAKATSTAELAEGMPKRTNQGPDAKRDSLLQYLARHGKGLDSKEAEAQGIDKADMGNREAKVGIRRAFRKGGLSFDHAAEMLSEAGYPVVDEKGNYSPNVLLDRISDELAGRKSFSVHNQSEMQRLEDEHFDNERQMAEEKAREIAANEPERAKLHEKFMVEWRNATPELRKEASEYWDKAETMADRQKIIDLLKDTNDAQRPIEREAGGTGNATAEVRDLQTPEKPEQPKAAGAGEGAGTEQSPVRTAAERAGGVGGEGFAVEPEAVKVDKILEERPDMMIPDAGGNMIDAAPAMDQAEDLETQAKAEAEAGFQSAIDCLKRA
jgi:hypothetical protein